MPLILLMIGTVTGAIIMNMRVIRDAWSAKEWRLEDANILKQLKRIGREGGCC